MSTNESKPLNFELAQRYQLLVQALTEVNLAQSLIDRRIDDTPELSPQGNERLRTAYRELASVHGELAAACADLRNAVIRGE